MSGAFGTGGRGAALLRRAVEDFVALAGTIDDENLAVAGTPDWSADEVIRHVASLPSWYLDPTDIGMAASRDDILRVSSEARSTLDGVSRPDAIRRMQTSADAFAAAVDTDPDAPVPFHGGTTLTRAALGGVLLGEILVHGRDLAAAVAAPWVIDRSMATYAVLSAAPVLPILVTDHAAGHRAIYDLRLRGTGERLRLSFGDGALTVGPATAARPDVTIDASPVDLLTVLYGRTSQWSSIARGRLVAWGRRPWLAFGLVRLLRAP